MNGYRINHIEYRMTENNYLIENSIKIQREILTEVFSKILARISKKCRYVLGDYNQLNKKLMNGVKRIPYCTSLYAMNAEGIQVSANISKNGLLDKYYQLDRLTRPYMLEVNNIDGNFLLSSAYISKNEHRPSITAVQVIRKDNKVLGFLAVDIDLRNLPVSTPLYKEPNNWRQIKGDPSIRSTVFQQNRTESILDKNSVEVLAILEELYTERGIFQSIIHYSSSQAIIWVLNEPYQYRVLEPDVLANIDICMAYPLQDYPKKALIPKNSVKPILKQLQKLRLVDDTLYLRSASINIFNGLIGLTFSCDGSHYMPYDEFLKKEISFWGCE